MNIMRGLGLGCLMLMMCAWTNALEPDDVRLFEGDILVRTSVRPYFEGALHALEAMHWPKGVVPYVFDADLPEANQLAIYEAMALWEAKTPVRFLHLTPENRDEHPDHVVFEPAEGRTCASFVGRQGGMQSVRLAPRCGVMQTVHELGHVLGLWHEQSRQDRDAYVQVCWNNIAEAHQYNFKKYGVKVESQGPYDFDSIMHYSAKAFSKNGKPTLVSRAPGVMIGQREHVSVGDVDAVNALYSEEKQAG